MDPLSITLAAAGLSKLAYSIAGSITTLIEASKGGDENTRAFATEISALATTLNLVDAAFPDNLKVENFDPAAPRSSVYLRHVLTNLSKIISDCEDTLRKLEIISKDSLNSFRNTILRKSVTAFKLNLKSEEIASIRSQIQSYTSAMQMTLSMVNISLVVSQTRIVPNLQTNLRDKLVSLEETMENLQSAIASNQALNNGSISTKKLDNLKEYLKTSESVYSSASSYLGSLDTSSAGVSDLSERASVLSMNTEQRVAIESWRDDQFEESENKKSFVSMLNSKRVALAETKMQAQAYADAERLLKTFLSNAEGADSQAEQQLNEAQIMLASCYQSQMKWKEAIEIYLEILRDENCLGAQESLVKHNLARTYYKSSDVKEAVPWAVAACEARHNEQPDSLFFESCLLAAQIHMALGDTVEAELYINELPASYQSLLHIPNTTASSPFSEQIQPPQSGLTSSQIPGQSHNKAKTTTKTTHQTASAAAMDPSSLGKNMLSFPPELEDDNVPPSIAPSSTSLVPLMTSPKPRQMSLPISRRKSSSSEIPVSPTTSRRSSIELRKPSISRGLHKIVHSHTEIVWSVDISPDKKTLVSGSADYTLKIWDTETRKVRKTLSGHGRSVNSVTFSPDGRTIASGSSDRTIKFWNADDGHLVRILEGHVDLINAVKFSHQGHLLASGSGAAIESVDNRVLLWSSAAGQPPIPLSGHVRAVKSVAFSPDDQTLLSGSFDGTMKLWDVEKADLLMTIDAHTGWINSVAFSPDGRYMVSASWDLNIKYWDAANGALLRTCQHDRPVSCVVFLPDSQTTASVDRADTVTLCNATHRSHSTIKSKTKGLLSITISSDGSTITCGSVNKAVEILSLDQAG